MPDHFDDLRHEDEGHAEEATKNSGQRGESVARVLLARDNHYHRYCYETQNYDIIYRHSYVSGIIDQFDFDASRLIRQKEPES